MKTPEEMTDAELNEAVAVEVAGWRHTVASEKMGTRWWVDENGGHISPYNDPDSGCSFATSADAVLPLLEKHTGPWNMDYDGKDKRPENRYQVYLHFPHLLAPEQSMKCGNASTFPRAACIALLKAARAKKEGK